MSTEPAASSVPASSVRGSPFLQILTSTCYFLHSLFFKKKKKMNLNSCPRFKSGGLAQNFCLGVPFDPLGAPAAPGSIRLGQLCGRGSRCPLRPPTSPPLALILTDWPSSSREVCLLGGSRKAIQFLPRRLALLSRETGWSPGGPSWDLLGGGTPGQGHLCPRPEA